MAKIRPYRRHMRRALGDTGTLRAIRKGFEGTYFISSQVTWNGSDYVAKSDIARKHATIINNWFQVWREAVRFALTRRWRK